MGNLLRQFWFPLVPSDEVPGPGSRPLRMKLLGEQLILFRNSEGVIGLVSEFCPHRSASLYFARNESSGLRCVYHGWLIGTDGKCLDMPNEPVGASFKEKVRQPWYPCREVNGTVWTYMGPREEPPPLPDFGLISLPADQKGFRLTVRDCNWMQALEGDLDLSHGAYLHSALRENLLAENHLDRYTGERPHMEALDTPYGVAHAVRRSYGPDQFHWGVGHFIFPFITQFPPVGDRMEVVPGHVWIPMDDVTTLVWSYQWHPTKPLREAAAGSTLGGGQGSKQSMFEPEWEEYLPPLPEPGGKWRQKATRENSYGFNEEAQATIRYSGIPTVELQDRALQESMRPLVDRSIEHLGTTDIAQIRVRQRLLKSADELQKNGTLPTCVDDPALYRVRSASGILPRDVSWTTGTQEWVQEQAGVPVASRGHRTPDPKLG
jgi:nitrite reductase/ring-hydroxylating ferredoxin subunit